MTVVSAHDLVVRYGPTTALSGMTFEGHAGESVAVVGHSGSGKSTLLRCLAGLQAPTSGTVLFEGADIYRRPERERAAIRLRSFGFVFQSSELVGELMLLENIALPIELNGVRRRDALRLAAKWAEDLGISDAAARRPRRVSGGQRQRAAIARALATGPRVVFADEPTGALDSHIRDTVLSLLLQACAAAGCLLVLVTHDPVAAMSTNRLVRMTDGRVDLSLASLAGMP